jgi:hypothetical protein
MNADDTDKTDKEEALLRHRESEEKPETQHATSPTIRGIVRQCVGCVLACFTNWKGYQTQVLVVLRFRASYQTFVLNLSIDKRQGLCDITTML